VAEDTAAPERSQWTVSEPTAWDTSHFAALLAVIREDRQATPSSWHRPGLQALAVHRFGEWVYSNGRPRRLRRPAAVLNKMLRVYVRNVLGFEIQEGARIGLRVRFMHQHGVVIDRACVIGDDCVFHHGVTLGGRHKIDSSKNAYQVPQIGSGVWFGAGCIVLGGIRIGDGASIGPNAVVMRDVPPGASVIAQPPRVIRLL
jgi:serine O-acetyltransferase